MPWKETTVMGQRADLAQEMLRRKQPVRVIAAKYGVSRTTAYEWQQRFAQHGLAGMAQRSRRPAHSPHKTAADIEERICALRQRYPTWGSRKLHRLLANEGLEGLPCERTVARVVSRNGYAAQQAAVQPAAQRFERPAPNELWQVDCKTVFYLHSKPRQRVVPMTVLDDHSRFLVGLYAHGDRQVETLWPALWELLGEYGMPQCILTDNDRVFRGHRGGITTWTARLWRLGIEHISGRPYHPQTQGKVERLHGTLQGDLLADRLFRDWDEVRSAFAQFRELYNHHRPHEALQLDVPADHYRASDRQRPAQLPPVEYAPGALLRKVWANGAIHIRGCRVHVGEGIAGEHVQLTDTGAAFGIQYAGHTIREVPWDDLHRDGWA
jgi:transposase InsO family protein